MRTAGLLLALGCLVAADTKEKAETPQRIRTLTLQEAVDLGLAYNLGLKTARLDTLMARLDVDVANAAWDVTLTTFVELREDIFPSRTQLAGAAVVDTDRFNWTVGVTKPFRMGPTLGLSWRADREFTNSTFSTINPSYDTSLELTLTVPLLRGRGTRVQEADLRAAQAGAQGASYVLLGEAIALIDDIATAFWNARAQDERVKVLQKSVEVAREIEDTERRKMRPEIGRSTPLDVTTAHAETKRREVALIQGRLDAANAADDLRHLVLPFTGGPGDRVVLSAIGRPEAPGEAPALNPLVETALARRPDLLRQDTDIRRLKEEVIKAEDQLRVQLDLAAGVTWRGVDSTYESAARQSWDGSFPSTGASINLIWPLGRRAARAALRRAQIDHDRAQLVRRQEVNNVVVEVRKAQRQLRTSIEEIAATQEEVTAAAAALDGERKRLARGSSTVLDVSQLEENLTQAQLRLLQAYLDLETARVGLLRVTGTMLDEFDLELGPDLKVRHADKP